MTYAVLDRTFSPSLSSPATYQQWMEVNSILDGCLEARNVHWLYSLVSQRGDRSICLFQLSYSDLVREACREARMPFERVWQADLWQDLDPTTLPQGSALIVAEVRYNPPITKSMYESAKLQGKECFQELNVQYLLSAVMLNGSYSVCVFKAAMAEDVRSLYRKIGQPFQHVWKTTLVKPG